MTVLRSFGFWQPHFLTIYGIQIGSSLEISATRLRFP
jgi:hypothetical protein